MPTYLKYKYILFDFHFDFRSDSDPDPWKKMSDPHPCLSYIVYLQGKLSIGQKENKEREVKKRKERE